MITAIIDIGSSVLLLPIFILRPFSIRCTYISERTNEEMCDPKENGKNDTSLRLSKKLAATCIESIGRQWDTAVMTGGCKCVRTTSFTNYSEVKQMKI